MTEKITVNRSALIGKLNDLTSQCNGDLARVIELLLLENHVLTLHQSSGLKRGKAWDFSEFPRFLQLDDRPPENAENCFAEDQANTDEDSLSSK